MKAKTSQAQVAAILKAYAKSKGIKASAKSESFAGGNSVTLYVQDLPPAMYDDLNAEANKYVYGKFNGMEDIYEYDYNRDDNLPRCKYISVNNEISDALRQKIWDFLIGYFGLVDAPADEKMAYSYRDQRFCNDWGNDGSNMIYRFFRGSYMYEAFWDFVNAEKIAA